MSFGPKVFSGVQEMLVLALMLVTVFALFYVDMDITYKIGVAVIVFAVIFLTTLATQILKQQEEAKKAAAHKNCLFHFHFTLHCSSMSFQRVFK